MANLMKIYDSNLSGTAASETRGSQDVQRSGGKNRTGQVSSMGSGVDQVELSGTLGQISRTLSAFQSGRANRVQALAAQYQSGSFHPDSMAIGQSIVQEMMNARLQ